MERGWTMYRTAQKCNNEVTGKPVTLQYISNIESMSTTLGTKARKKWAAIFGVDVSEFMKSAEKVNELALELERLKIDAEKIGLDNIKRLRELIPIIYGGEDGHENGKRHVAQKEK